MKALVIINVGKDESMKIALEMKEYLNDLSVETDFINFDGFSDNFTISNYDFAITLGGDGTVLYAARNCVENNIPIFPVNLGQFGFIATVQPEDWKKELLNFLHNDVVKTQRLMLKAEVLRNKKSVYSSFGLNEIVICAKLISDGVIVSTPTGSTAYSAAAGGPIIDSEMEACVLTPVNPFSLSSRPLVLNPNGKIQIKVCSSRNKDACISVDGQQPFQLQCDDKIVIQKLEKKITLISSTQEKFYNALRSKLNWSGVPHA